MSLTCPVGAGEDSPSIVFGAFNRLWNIKPEDIAADWINAMTNRLLAEINRQLAAVEAVKYDNTTDQPVSGERLANARTLATLRDTLEKVMRMKTQHAATIESRKARDYVNAREGVVHRADQRLAAARKSSGS